MLGTAHNAVSGSGLAAGLYLRCYQWAADSVVRAASAEPAFCARTSSPELPGMATAVPCHRSATAWRGLPCRRCAWLGYAIAGKIVTDPDAAIAVARHSIETMLLTQRGAGRRWLTRWNDLLEGPTEEILATLTSNSITARELRQNNPFAGLLDDATRLQVITATGHRKS